MQENFTRALQFVLADEGGNDDDPADHGGRTSRGITQSEYTAWCIEQHVISGDVWKAPDAYITAIYQTEYWQPWCDLIPRASDYVFFDMAVNAGPHRAIILGQRALGVVADGRVGPVTRAAMRVVTDPMKLLRDFDAQKRAFYRALHQPKFLQGWLNRCDHVLKNAGTFF